MSDARRNAKEWAGLVRQWGRSGQTAEQFATARGLSPRTLVWWKWRLKREASGDKPARTRPDVRLVPVRVEAEPERARMESEGLAWELEAPSGHVLRVFERGGVAALREALMIVERGGRRR